MPPPAFLYVNPTKNPQEDLTWAVFGWSGVEYLTNGYWAFDEDGSSGSSELAGQLLPFWEAHIELKLLVEGYTVFCDCHG